MVRIRAVYGVGEGASFFLSVPFFSLHAIAAPRATRMVLPRLLQCGLQLMLLLLLLDLLRRRLLLLPRLLLPRLLLRRWLLPLRVQLRRPALSAPRATVAGPPIRRRLLWLLWLL